jgi:hypothetical protein
MECVGFARGNRENGGDPNGEHDNEAHNNSLQH